MTNLNGTKTKCSTKKLKTKKKDDEQEVYIPHVVICG